MTINRRSTDQWAMLFRKPPILPAVAKTLALWFAIFGLCALITYGARYLDIDPIVQMVLGVIIGWSLGAFGITASFIIWDDR